MAADREARSAAHADPLEARRDARTYRRMFRGELPPDRAKAAAPIPLRVACGKCLEYVPVRKDGRPKAHDCPGKPLPRLRGRVVT